jgi:hypothetical protein
LVFSLGKATLLRRYLGLRRDGKHRAGRRAALLAHIPIHLDGGDPAFFLEHCTSDVCAEVFVVFVARTIVLVEIGLQFMTGRPSRNDPVSPLLEDLPPPRLTGSVLH